MSDAVSLVRIGQRNAVVTIQNPTTVALGGGSSTTTYASGLTIRVKLRRLRGNEGMQARQVIGTAVYEATGVAKEATTLTHRSRLLWQSATGQRILELKEDPRTDTGRHFTVLCAEKIIPTV